jgi:hypothetical protein
MSLFSIAKRIVRAKVVLVSALGSLAAFAAACSNADKSPAPAPAPKPSQAPVATAAQPSASAPVEVTSADVSDAGAAPDAGYTGPRIGATALVTVVMSDMEWPRDDARKGDKSGKGAVRIGYLRHGARAPVIPERHVKPNCPEGWYELVGGGFVCGRYATLDLNHPRVKLAPHEPDLEGPLPYQYGYNTMNGVPLYRQVPSHDERMKLEPWLAGGSLPSTAESRPSSKRKKRGSASGEEASGGSGSSATAQPGDVQVQNDEADSGAMFGLALASQKTTEEPEVPWYMRDAGGSAKPQVTLDDLRGEGPVARRMVKGFYVALDKQFVSGGWSWWKTTSGLIAPADKLYVQKALTDFKGTWISELPAGSAAATEAGMAPNPLVGWALYKTKKYQIVGKKAVAGEGTVARFTQLKLTGKTGVFGGVRYDETEEGWWLRVNEGTRTKPGALPKDLAPGEKWVDVNLTTQTLVAYEGDKPAFATLTSTGRRESKEKDYTTPQGSFRIREKHVAATMDGDVATDGPYSIEDVPWIMYFNGSYALHGAFWHAAFGHVKSHGCVNLTPSDARTMFNWTEPHLPEGWHGVNATAEKPGTRVVVHD